MTDVVPLSSTCNPIGRRLGESLGPYRGFAQSKAPERPLFSFEESERIAQDWRALPAPRLGGEAEDQAVYDAHYNSTKKAFRFYDAATGVWHTWVGEELGLAIVYPIGEGAWKWDCRP